MIPLVELKAGKHIIGLRATDIFVDDVMDCTTQILMFSGESNTR